MPISNTGPLTVTMHSDPPGWNREYKHFDTFDITEIITPRDYQQLGHGELLKLVDEGKLDDGKAVLFIGPTGTGKSVSELMWLGFDSESFLVTPRVEIILGLMNKLGYSKEELDKFSTQRLADEALAFRISTPIRLRNLLATGKYKFRPQRLIIDEGHHLPAETYQLIKAYWPGISIICFTASGFRGTSNATAEFHNSFDYIYNLLTIPQAVKRGIIEIPEIEIWPLTDDDEITIQNGDFKVSTAGELNQPILADVVDRCSSFISSDKWDRPTIFAVPTTDNAIDLTQRLCDYYGDGIATTVLQDTSRQDRNKAFKDCLECRTAIVQIDVVSEGIDYPFRRLIDLRPTMSPVKWIQQIGRITRPGGKSQYICTNRNLERHSYLMQGMIKAGRVAEAQQVFGYPTQRSNARVVGLEGIGKFKAAEIEAIDGTICTMYCVHSFDGFDKKEYAIILHPCVDYPLVAYKESTVIDGKMVWGKWRKLDSLPDIKGFQSTPAGSLTKPMKDFWYRASESVCINPQSNVNRKNFQALPVLLNTKSKLKIGGF
jgi:hypothetical protein